jgi:propionate CoA-transferase
MDYWMRQLSPSGKRGMEIGDDSANIIGMRAVRELKSGDVVNIGIGIPELVGKYASEVGILKDIILTVEAGGIGGLPAPGLSFGATIGSDMICDMASQFDFYDGGGLDICFMGGIEVDRHGNVNAHKIGSKFVGIGGFANITNKTKTVVFCLTFTTKGLAVKRENNKVIIQKEGSVPKFKESIHDISFSASNALKNGQKVLYVTERCVFGLTQNGIKLLEVFDGIDQQKDVIGSLDFEV